MTETNLLVISYRRGPDAWLGDWQTHVGSLPADLSFIDVGGTTRSTATASAPTTSSHHFVKAVPTPGDLTELGIQISEVLKQWESTENQILVYFESLTALLQYAELNRAYRFLHVLTGRIQTVDGCAYYRLIPDAHDKQTRATLQSVVDRETDLR